MLKTKQRLLQKIFRFFIDLKTSFSAPACRENDIMEKIGGMIDEKNSVDRYEQHAQAGRVR